MRFLKYLCLILCIVSFVVCALNLLGGMVNSSAASKDSASLSSKDMSPEVRHMVTNAVSQSSRGAVRCMQWAIATLVLGVVLGGVFFLLPAPAVGPGEPGAAQSTTKRIALRTFVVVGLLTLVGVAFLSGVALAAYFIFTHMGP